MEKIQYCDCFHLNQSDFHDDQLEHPVNQIVPSQYLSDFNDGIFLLDSPCLYILSKDHFFSIPNAVKGQNTELKKHFKVDQHYISFVINSGRVYLMYRDKILIYMLHVTEPPKKVMSSKELLGIVLVGSQVFVCTEYEIKVLINDQMLMTWHKTQFVITKIKPGFRNTNEILVEFCRGFEIVRVENESQIESVFSMENLDELQVEFFNKEMVLIYHFQQKIINFIQWTQSEESVYSLDLSEYRDFQIKTKKNILVLTSNDSSIIHFIFFNKFTNNFLFFKACADIIIDQLDFDHDYSEFTHICKQKGSFLLNFYFNSNNFIHYFCLNLDLMQSFIIFYTLQTHPKPITLENPQPIDRNPGLVESFYQLVPDVPKFVYPEKIVLKSKVNQELEPQKAQDLEDEFEYFSRIQSFFTNEKLESSFTQAFLNATFPQNKPKLDAEPLFDPNLLEGVKNTASEIQRFLNR